MEKIKKCLLCERLLSASQFYVDRSRKAGLALHCKQCVKAKVAAWRVDNLDRAKAKVSEWHKLHPERSKEIHRAWVNKNYERNAMHKRLWYENNRPNPRIKLTSDQIQEGKTLGYIRRRDSLSDSYVALILRIRTRDCPPELIDAKREHLQIYRLTKELTEVLNEVIKGEKE